MLIVLAGMALNFAVAALEPNVASSLIASLLFLYFLVKCYQSFPAATIILLPVIVPHLAGLISINFIDFGAYMPEIGRNGFTTHAAASFAFFNALMFYASIIALDALVRRFPIRVSVMSGTWHRLNGLICIGVGAVAVLYLAIAGVFSGFPLLTETDRFVFRSQTADIVTFNLLNLKFVLAAMLGVTFASSPVWLLRVVSLAQCVALTLLYLLYGDKFFTIFCFLCFFVGPAFALHTEAANRYLKLILPFSLVFLGVLFALNVYIYSDYGNTSIDQAFVKLGERIAAQGQIWFLYVAYEESFFAFDAHTIYLNFLSIFAENGQNFNFDNNLSTFYFAMHYAPFRLLDSMIRNAGTTTFTMAYEAYTGVMLGTFGVFVVMPLTGLLFAAISYFYLRAIQRMDCMMILAPASVLTQAWFMTNQGTISVLLSLGSLKIIGALWLMGYVMRGVLFSFTSLEKKDEGYESALQNGHAKSWERL